MSRTPECLCGECHNCKWRVHPLYAAFLDRQKAIRKREKLWPDGICACRECVTCRVTDALLKEPFGPMVYMQAGDYVNFVG